MTTRAPWRQTPLTLGEGSAARLLRQKFQDSFEETELQPFQHQTRIKLANLLPEESSPPTPDLLLTASSRDLELAAKSSPPRPPDENSTLRIRFATRTSIRSPETRRVLDVMVAFVLEIADDRILFRFEDSDGAGREGWLKREAIPLQVEDGDVLQIKVMAQGPKTWLHWRPAPQPTREDYERARESFPPMDES